MKTVMVLLMIAVLGALASAGVFMLRKGAGAQKDGTEDRSRHMARALALRVALSVALFLFILLGWYMGWVKPTGIPMSQ
jgi:cytochrome bd-type quinol oxidase subunit 2